jgi:signal peptide peptidase SppA
MIRYPHLLSLYESSIWAIDPLALVALGRGLGQHLSGMQQAFALDMPKPGSADPVSGGVAVIPMFGAIGKYLSSMEIACMGGCSLDRTSAALSAALADSEVGAIVLHINSPGGTVTGVPEFSRQIAAASKPVYAYSDSVMASAAYWVGCSCAGVFASESASIGSIGVYMAFLDYTRQLENKGIDVRLVRAGRLKAIGMPGTWSDEVEAHLQEGVNETYDAFTSWVREHRGEIADDTMQGQGFSARKALTAGLIDEIVNDISEVVANVAAAHNLTQTKEAR